MAQCSSGSSGVGKLFFNSACVALIQYFFNTDTFRTLSIWSNYSFGNNDFVSPFKIEVERPGLLEMSKCVKVTAVGKFILFVATMFIMAGVGSILNSMYDVQNPDNNCSHVYGNEWLKSLYFSLSATILYFIFNNKTVVQLFNGNMSGLVSGDPLSSQENCRKTSFYGWVILLSLVFVTTYLIYIISAYV